MFLLCLCVETKDGFLFCYHDEYFWKGGHAYMDRNAMFYFYFLYLLVIVAVTKIISTGFEIHIYFLLSGHNKIIIGDLKPINGRSTAPTAVPTRTIETFGFLHCDPIPQDHNILEFGGHGVGIADRMDMRDVVLQALEGQELFFHLVDHVDEGVGGDYQLLGVLGRRVAMGVRMGGRGLVEGLWG